MGRFNILTNAPYVDFACSAINAGFDCYITII